MKRALLAVLTSGVIACGAPHESAPAVVAPPPARAVASVPAPAPAWPTCASRLDQAKEAYPLAAREFDRAAAEASPVIAAHVLAAIPQLFVDVSDASWRPPFVEDYTSRLAELPRVGDEIVLSVGLLGRVRALARPATSVKGAEAQARALRLLIDAPPAAFGAGREGEAAFVTPSLVNRTALAAFAVSGLAGHDRASRDFFARRRAEPATDEEAALLWPDDVSDFVFPPQKRAVYNPARLALFEGWIGEVRRRLAGPADPVSAKLVADRLFALGVAAPRVGLTAEVRALASEILARKGDFPLLRGQREWTRTVHAAAAAARFDVDHPVRGYRAPHLYAFDEGHEHGFDLLRAELPARADRTSLGARVAAVDAELARVQHDAARCYLLKERAWATPAGAEADAYFDALLDLRDNADPLCRVEAALAMPGIPAPRRAQGLVRLLRDRESRVGGACLQSDIWSSGDHQRNELAFGLIGNHADLVDVSPELRAWLFANGSDAALAPWIFNDTERVYRRAFAHATPSEAPAAKRLVAGWMDAAQAEHRDRESFAIEHIVALIGAYASQYGLEADARRFYAGMKPDDEPRSRAVGMALLEL